MFINYIEYHLANESFFEVQQEQNFTTHQLFQWKTAKEK